MVQKNAIILGATKNIYNKYIVWKKILDLLIKFNCDLKYQVSLKLQLSVPCSSEFRSCDENFHKKKFRGNISSGRDLSKNEWENIVKTSF